MMDETYIKMCRKAEEIQELWKPKLFDNIIFSFSNGFRLETSMFKGFSKLQLNEMDIMWCPSQENLQEIILKYIWKDEKHFGGGMYYLIDMFYEYVEKISKEARAFQETFNQMWLCFVMETCYGKRWDSVKSEWAFI
jgi:hypothetical protein